MEALVADGRSRAAAIAVLLALSARAPRQRSPARWWCSPPAAVLDVLLQRRVGAWGYLEREDDLLVQRGLMVRRLSVVPYGRMQFVDVTAGPVERSFGLATVRLHTAAAASDARIPGLEAAEAARLRDQLAALGESRAAGL